MTPAKELLALWARRTGISVLELVEMAQADALEWSAQQLDRAMTRTEVAHEIRAMKPKETP